MYLAIIHLIESSSTCWHDIAIIARPHLPHSSHRKTRFSWLLLIRRHSFRTTSASPTIYITQTAISDKIQNAGDSRCNQAGQMERPFPSQIWLGQGNQEGGWRRQGGAWNWVAQARGRRCLGGVFPFPPQMQFYDDISVLINVEPLICN